MCFPPHGAVGVCRYQENFAGKVPGAEHGRNGESGAEESGAKPHMTVAQQTQARADHLLKKRMAEEGIDHPKKGERAKEQPQPEVAKPVDPVRGMLDTVAVLMSRQLRGKCEAMFLQVRRHARRDWEGLIGPGSLGLEGGARVHACEM